MIERHFHPNPMQVLVSDTQDALSTGDVSAGSAKSFRTSTTTSSTNPSAPAASAQLSQVRVARRLNNLMLNQIMMLLLLVARGIIGVLGAEGSVRWRRRGCVARRGHGVGRRSLLPTGESGLHCSKHHSRSTGEIASLVDLVAAKTCSRSSAS